MYRKLSFSPGFWVFTFSYAVAATDALLWVSVKNPPGAVIYAACLVAAITALVAMISVRTVGLLLQGRLFPMPPLKPNDSNGFRQNHVGNPPVTGVTSTHQEQGGVHA